MAILFGPHVKTSVHRPSYIELPDHVKKRSDYNTCTNHIYHKKEAFPAHLWDNDLQIVYTMTMMQFQEGNNAEHLNSLHAKFLWKITNLHQQAMNHSMHSKINIVPADALVLSGHQQSRYWLWNIGRTLSSLTMNSTILTILQSRNYMKYKEIVIFINDNAVPEGFKMMTIS